MITNAQKTPAGFKSQEGIIAVIIVKKLWSEWRDSNPRPLHPQYSALPGCATLRLFAIIHYRQTGMQAELRKHFLC